jgi:hypothetical protein
VYEKRLVVLPQNCFDGHLFGGVELQTAKGLALEAQTGERSQPVAGCGRGAVAEVQDTVGRDKGDSS